MSKEKEPQYLGTREYDYLIMLGIPKEMSFN